MLATLLRQGGAAGASGVEVEDGLLAGLGNGPVQHGESVHGGAGRHTCAAVSGGQGILDFCGFLVLPQVLSDALPCSLAEPASYVSSI